jgi:hypothetical protein
VEGRGKGKGKEKRAHLINILLAFSREMGR